MTSTIVLVALAALFVGVSIPVLLQLRATLRETERRLEALGERLDKILEDSQVVANRLARASRGLEGGDESIRDLMEAVGQLSKTMTRSAGWLGMATSFGTVLGPTVAAAVRAYRATPHAEQEEAEVEEEVGLRPSGVSPLAGGSHWEAARGHGEDGSTEEFLFRGLVDGKNEQQEQQQPTQERSRA